MTLAQFAFAFADVVRRWGSWRGSSVGVGDAMVFIPLLRLVALWFPPVRIPMVTQLTGLLGQMGALVAASPLVAALHHWGWTPSFATAAGGRRAARASCSCSSCGTRPTPTTSSTRSRSAPSPARVRAAWDTPGTRLGLWSHFSAQFGATVFALLWGYPFLVAGQGLAPETAGLLLMLMTLTAVVCGPARRRVRHQYPFSRSTLILGIVGAIAGVWAVVLLWPGAGAAVAAGACSSS